MRTPAWCRKKATEIGPACTELIDGLLADNALYRLRAAQGVLHLADKHQPGRLEAACAKAAVAGDPSYRTVGDFRRAARAGPAKAGRRNDPVGQFHVKCGQESVQVGDHGWAPGSGRV
jgi:hypothetical protein